MAVEEERDLEVLLKTEDRFPPPEGFAEQANVSDPAVYDEIREDDTISVFALDELAPDRLVECRIQHADGTTVDFQCTHTMSLEHIDWFRAGGALNLIRNQQKGA